MYQDDQNLYHNTFYPDESQTGRPAQAARPTVDEQLNQYQHYQQSQQNQNQTGPEGPVQELKPVKKNRVGLKITALALACALVGGAVGGGVVWGVSRGGESSIQVSDRTVKAVTVKTVDGKAVMTDAEVYAANVNSVVSINVTGTSGYNFFGQPVQTASAGSGFILTSDGYIVTNYHVVENADTVEVSLYNGETLEARFVGGDEDYDIAVIKVEATDLSPVVLGDSDGVNVGDHVLAIGNPLGELTFSMS